jgi:hypothetical protein
LSLLVLGAVRIPQPVHGYDVRRGLLGWHLEEWTNLETGSLGSPGARSFARSKTRSAHPVLDRSLARRLARLTRCSIVRSLEDSLGSQRLMDESTGAARA